MEGAEILWVYKMTIQELLDTVKGTALDISSIPYVMSGIRPPAGTGAVMKAPMETYTRPIESPYNFDTGTDPMIQKYGKDVASALLLADLAMSGQSALGGIKNALDLERYKKLMGKVSSMSKEKGWLSPSPEHTNAFEQIIFNKFFPLHETYDQMYGGLPVKFGGKPSFASQSKIADLISKSSQTSWQGGQLLGFLQGKAPKDEIDTFIKPMIDTLKPKFTKEEILQNIEQNTPQVEEVVKGQIKTEDAWKQRIASNMFGHDYKGLTEGEKSQVDTELNIAKSQGDLDIEELTTDEELQRATKFQQYQLPGGENYREVLIKAGADVPELNAIAKDMYGKNYTDLKGGNEQQTALMRRNVKRQYNKENPDKRALESEQQNIFKSSHWDEPNVLAHLRMNDRTTPDGKKVLFIEELQSDWAKEVREEKEKPVTLNEDEIKFEMEQTGLSRKEAIARIKEMMKEAPTSHPLLKNWQELALKRAIKEAVEGGYDYISWTTGEQQSERYDLSKQIDYIRYSKNPRGSTDKTYIQAQKGSQVIIKEDIPNEKLADYIGKETAKKILDSKEEGGILSGIDLKIGGEWAKNLYDRQIPNILKDLTKGEVININFEGTQPKVINSGNGYQIMIGSKAYGVYATKKEALGEIRYLEKQGTIQKFIPTQPALKITPEIRDWALGIPKEGGVTKKGGVE